MWEEMKKAAEYWQLFVWGYFNGAISRVRTRSHLNVKDFTYFIPLFDFPFTVHSLQWEWDRARALFLAFHNLCFSVKISHFRILWLDIIFLLCVIHSETFDWLRSCNIVCHFAAYTKALALVNKHIFFKFTFFHGIFSQLQNLLRFPSKKYFIIFFFIFVYLPALYFRPLNCVWLFLWFSFSFFQFVF